METKFYMAIGLPASGKSFYGKKIMKESNIEIISSDTIREELFGDINDQIHNKEVFNELHKRVYKALSEGRSCYYDATNLSRRRRRNFLKTLPKNIEKIAILFATEYDIIFEQNKKRERHVPEDVIVKMAKRMTIPRKDEGWDKVIIQTHENNHNDLGYYLDRCMGIKHDNSHHKLDIHEHMIATRNVAEEISKRERLCPFDSLVLTMAARYHDVGKSYCKTFETYSGKITEEAHYYNHAEIGAYLAACASDFYNHSIIRLVMLLIQYHMDFYDRNRNVIENFEGIFGADLKRLLILLHEADQTAH